MLFEAPRIAEDMLVFIRHSRQKRTGSSNTMAWT